MWVLSRRRHVVHSRRVEWSMLSEVLSVREFVSTGNALLHSPHSAWLLVSWARLIYSEHAFKLLLTRARLTRELLTRELLTR